MSPDNVESKLAVELVSSGATRSPIQSAARQRLNLGCGKDPWGDVRVDMDGKGTANIFADAHYLPFADKSFSTVRCWHVLEHCMDPWKSLQEAKRVAQTVHARFPYRFDRIPWALSSFSSLSLRGVRAGFLQIWLDVLTKTIKRRHPHRHLWMIQPFGRVKLNGLPFPSFFAYGRKARFLSKLAFYIPAEWECDLS